MPYPARRPVRSRKKSFVLLTAVVMLLAAAGVYWWLHGGLGDLQPLRYVFTSAGLGREFGEPFGVAVRGSEIYVSDGEAGMIWLVRSGTSSLFAGGLQTPSAMALDKAGNLIVADSGAHVIRSVSSTGEVSVLAGAVGRSGFADGDAAAALFNGPIGIAISDNGQIFVADTYNDRIRVIDNGAVRTIAGGIRGFADGAGPDAKFDTPTGVAFRQDKVLVADAGNHRIRVIEPDGRVWTLAGDGTVDVKDGTLLSASFYQPTGLAIASSGEIYVTDGSAVRVITGGPLPVVRTVSAKERGLKDGRLAGARFNRPSCLAFAEDGDLLITDSDNRLLRVMSASEDGHQITSEESAKLFGSAEEFRSLQPPRWPYDPPDAKREIAGTLGEIRGDMPPQKDPARFHNGLDIAGAYGETARFVRSEKLLRPIAAENFGTLREFIRMPSMGYIHIRLGRDASGTPFGDPRFQFERDAGGKLNRVRVPRGSAFTAGEPIGTLNAMNHVHLITGRSGYEINALDALILPGYSDTRSPVIESIILFDDAWQPLETVSPYPRIKLSDKTRIVVRAYDQVDGNSDRRRLGVYRVGYQLLKADLSPLVEMRWTVTFDRMPSAAAVKYAYASGSHSGATGETVFNYIATNRVEGDSFAEDFLEASTLAAGQYILRVAVGDQSGNITSRDITVEITR